MVHRRRRSRPAARREDALERRRPGTDAVTDDDHGPVREAARSERYVFRWHAEIGGTAVEVDFDEHPGGSVVRRREHDYPDTPADWTASSERATGWDEALTLLKLHVEHGVHSYAPAPTPPGSALSSVVK